MNFEQMGNNRVQLMGNVSTEPIYSHHIHGEGFYELELSVKRLSDATDIIPVTLSERLMPKLDLSIGAELLITGQFRSYNKFDGKRSRLVLSVFAREVEQMTPEMPERPSNPNIIEIIGYVCKPPIYRTTPFKREICDVLIAVNRAYNKSDYIPCIAWGRNAKYVSNNKIGDRVAISGRIQSREYNKIYEDGTCETRRAYEVSVNKISEDLSIIGEIAATDFQDDTL